MDFKIGDIYQDADILKTAGKYADQVLTEDSGLTKQEHKLLGKHMENVLNAVDFRTI